MAGIDDGINAQDDNATGTQATDAQGNKQPNSDTAYNEANDEAGGMSDDDRAAIGLATDTDDPDDSGDDVDISSTSFPDSDNGASATINRIDAGTNVRKTGTQPEDIQGNPQPAIKSTYPQDTQGPRSLTDRPGEPVGAPSTAGGRTSPATGVILERIDSAWTASVEAVNPVNPFQKYASGTPDEIAARFASKQFGTPGNLHPIQFGARTSAVVPAHDATTDVVSDGNGLQHQVAGASATLDGNADRLIEQQLHQMTLAGGDTRPLEAQRDTGRAGVLNVRAPMPIFRRPEVAAGLETE
jgi:hypothetical protein